MNKLVLIYEQKQDCLDCELFVNSLSCKLFFTIPKQQLADKFDNRAYLDSIRTYCNNTFFQGKKQRYVQIIKM